MRTLTLCHTLRTCAIASAFCATALPALAVVVAASKDCSLSPCTYSGNTSTIGRFRLVGNASFAWDANYFGTPNRFWVSAGGINMADNALGPAGQLGGTATLSTGFWYISLKTALMGPGNYSVSGSNVLGDPHITTTNGVHYDFQSAGEFVLLRNGSDFEVQSRMRPVATSARAALDPHTGLQSCVSINTAAAVRVRGQRVTFQPREPAQGGAKGMELRVDGRLVTPGPRGLLLGHSARLFRDAASGEIRIAFADGSSVRVVPTWWAAAQLWYLDFDMSPPADVVGVVGPVASDGWLPALADGSPLGSMPNGLAERYKAIYQTFAESWRVTDATSLFDYASGTSTSTYTMKSWPPESGACSLAFAVPLQATTLAVAENACKGVIAPPLKRACIADVMTTGDALFGRSYQRTQGPVKVFGRAAEPRPRSSNR